MTANQQIAQTPGEEALRPIQVGALARQAGPPMTDLIFVALVRLLPAELHALCACAGLFYARVLVADGNHYHVEVAALPQYFSPQHPRRSAHVRTITLAHDAFAHLLDYDRSVAGRATCDIREIVEEHDAEVTRSQQTAAHKDTANVPPLVPTSEHQPAADAHPHRDARDEKKEAEEDEVDLVVLSRVSVPHRIVQEVFHRLHITANRERRVHTALLVAALDTIEMQLDSPLSLKKRARLEQEHQEIRRVQRWRRQRRQEGYGWQRVVALEPKDTAWEWQVVVGMPKDWEGQAA